MFFMVEIYSFLLNFSFGFPITLGIQASFKNMIFDQRIIFFLGEYERP